MQTKPLADVRQDLSRYVDDAATTHARVAITRNGRRVAVLLAADDYDAMQETLDVLSDAHLVADIRAALVDADAGDLATHDDVLAVLADLAARRPAAP